MNSFITRTISGIFILLLTIICLYFKGIFLSLYAILVNSFCMFELLNSFKIKDLFFKAMSVVFSIFIVYYIKDMNLSLILIFLSSIFIINSIYYLFFGTIKLLDFIHFIFSIVYISIPMGLFLKIGNSYNIWIVYIISWGTDTFAYLVGVLFGKYKLCPSISPKKTIEGSIGGVLGAVILLNIFNIYLFKYNFIFINITAIFTSVIAQMGDLFASKIKRESLIKDFGNLISGHGGVLDRFDSILFVVPVIYMIFYTFGGNI